MPWSVRQTLTLTMLTLSVAGSARGQSIIERARRVLDRATETTAELRELRCDVQGECGVIRQSEDFAPRRYNSLAVTVVDATRRFQAGHLGAARDVFEGRLIANGFLLAPNADVRKVRDLFNKGTESWTDAQLEELASFVTEIDAVLVVELQQVEFDTCRLDNRSATEATVSISVRWLNTPAGDVPWVGTHQASACNARNAMALSDALEKVSRQLATNLPTRGR